MNYSKTIFILFAAMFVVSSVQAQKRNNKKAAKKTVTKPVPKKQAEETTVIKEAGDTSAPKMVTITSAFKPFLKDAAKVNFTAATPVIDSSRMPVAYTIPSQNLFFSYQPVAIKPLALSVDSGYLWENNQYIKLGAGNFSTFYGEAAFSFGDGKNSVTNVRGNFLTSTGNLPAQQAAKWGIDLLSIFNTNGSHEWTAHPYYQSNTQYLYGYQPSTLPYTKESLLQRFTAVGVDIGMQNKQKTEFGITYHPQISASRYFDNNENHENNLVVKAPLNKAFGNNWALNVGLNADISTATFALIPTAAVFKNNLYSVNPAVQFKNENLAVNVGVEPSWSNKEFSLLPDLTAQAKVAELNLTFEAGWKGSYQKNTYRSITTYNPYIRILTALDNTKINEQFIGVKGSQSDHFTYEARASLLTMNNLPLFLNDGLDGKTFNVLFDPEVKAVRLHGELGYNVQEKFSVTAGANFTQYNSLAINAKPWGLLPIEATGSLKWKLLKDLQLKADAFLWDGAQYQEKGTTNARKANAVADLNIGAEFTVLPKLNVWLQMNNLLNSNYQRWNQYTVLGFNVLGGVVYSFR